MGFPCLFIVDFRVFEVIDLSETIVLKFGEEEVTVSDNVLVNVDLSFARAD